MKKTTKLSTKENFIQFLKFTMFSISAGVIQIISFTTLNELTNFPYWPSYLIALTLSVIYNFTLNRRFTFKSANNIPIAMMMVLGYYCVFTPLSTWWGDALSRGGMNEYIILIATMLINFVFTRFVVFRKSINTNSLAKKKLEKDMDTI